MSKTRKTQSKATSMVPSVPKFTTDSLGKHSAYIEELSRKYTALSQVVQEGPPSPPRCSLDEQGKRINALRERVQEAWVKADGNPADGKWGLLTQMLRMGVASGRRGRWAGARKDVIPPQEEDLATGWLNTGSQTAWTEWEKKYEEDRQLKDKVESWKRKVAVADDKVAEKRVDGPPSRSSDATTTTKVASDVGKKSRVTVQPVAGSSKMGAMASEDPLKSAAPFGFGVVKRSSQTNVVNEKSKHSRKAPPSPNSKGKDVRPPSAVHDTAASVQQKKIQDVSDIPELSFMPPSLLTSTPKLPAKPPSKSAKPISSSPLPPLTSSPKASAMQQPPVAAPTPQLSSSPKVGKTYGRHNKQSPTTQQIEVSASLPPYLPTTPTRHKNSKPSGNDADDYSNANNKRTLSPNQVDGEDGRAVKKARTLPILPSALSNPNSPKQTRMQPPTSPHTPKPSGTKLHAAAPAGVPTLTELLASAKKAKKQQSGGNKFPRAERIEKEKSPEAIEYEVGENPYVFDPFAVNGDGDLHEPLSMDVNGNDMSLDGGYDLELDLASPTKSLSSIADSDEEDDNEDDGDVVENAEIDQFALDSSFKPVATSTQPQHIPEARRGPFISKANFNTVTQPAEPHVSQNATDSWESVYNPRHNRAAGSSSHPASVLPSSLKALPSSGASLKSKNSNPFSPFPNPSYPAYNSQFESAVAAQVDRVDKLLEKDVDYEGWLKDPYADEIPEDEEDGRTGLSGPGISMGVGTKYSGSLNEGFGQNGSSYGYGKAFEYDESP